MLTFLSKWMLNAMIVVPFLFLFSEASFGGAVITATVLCIVSYLIGDQLILRQTNNMTATVADMGLTYVFLWMVADFMNWSLSHIELLSVSIAVGMLEFVLHSIMVANLTKANR